MGGGGGTKVTKRSTHARPGMCMQQCSAVLLFGPKHGDIQPFITLQPEGMLSALAEPCFVNPKVVYIIQYRKAHCRFAEGAANPWLIPTDQAVLPHYNPGAEELRRVKHGGW